MTYEKSQSQAQSDDHNTDSVPTVRLALGLGSALLLFFCLLSWLAPLGTPVSKKQLETLIDAGDVLAIDVGETAVVAYLVGPRMLTELEGGRPVRVETIRVLWDEVSATDQGGWRQAGIDVRLQTNTTDGPLGPYTWTIVVAMLLLIGGWHLVDQARRHRRDGSPRQRIADLEKKLQDGHIAPDIFRREVEQLSTEL